MSEVPVSTSTPKLIYILYLVSIIPFFGWLIGIIGLIMAYVNLSDAPEWLQGHYQFQIRTFWIGFLFYLIGWLTVTIAIGWPILFLLFIWWIARCAQGMKYLDFRQAHPNPTSWMFS